MSSGSPESATQRNGPRPSQNMRPDVRGHEAREVERVLDARLLRLRPQVVAVVEHVRAGLLEREHRADVIRHRRASRAPRSPPDRSRAAPRVARARAPPGRSRSAGRARRSGRSRGRTARRAAPSSGSMSAAFPITPIDFASPSSAPARGSRERVLEIVREHVEVAVSSRAAARAARPPRREVHTRRSSSRRAAARRPCRRARRRGPASRERAAEVLPRAWRTSRTCPAGCPACRCRSTTPRSSGRTSSGPSSRARGSAPRSPSGPRGSSWRSARAAPHGSRKTATGLPDWTSSVSSSLEAGSARGRSRRTPPVARGLAGAAVDDEILGVLGDVRIEVVHQHPQRGLLHPALAGQGRTTGSADGRGPETGSGGVSVVMRPSLRAPPTPRRAGQDRRTICCTDQRLPSGSAKNVNRPHGKSWTSLASTP